MSERVGRSLTSDELTLVEIKEFFRRSWKTILGLAVAATSVTALVSAFIVPAVWQASATLAILPPQFTSNLRPPSLTVQGYQKLLESDAVIAETRSRLVKANILEPNAALRLDHELETKIFVSRRSEETSLAPMVEAVATANSGATAELIANTWVAVFLDRAHNLMAGSTGSTVNFVESEYSKARESLSKAEVARLDTERAYRSRLSESKDRWARQISSYDVETAVVVGVQQAEMQALLEGFKVAHNLAIRQNEIDALIKVARTLQTERAGVNADLQRKQAQLKAVREQLGSLPALLTLRRSIPDDALWRIFTPDQGRRPDLKLLEGFVFTSEEPNPVYQELESSLVQLTSEVSSLEPRAAQIDAQLLGLGVRVEDLSKSLAGDEAELERLSQAQKAALQRLQGERDSGHQRLVDQRDDEVATISSERDTKLAQIGRDIAQQQALFGDLAKNFNQAVLAKAEPNVEDVRLAAPAVSPSYPQSRHVGLKAALGGLAGVLLGVIVSLFAAGDRITRDRP